MKTDVIFFCGLEKEYIVYVIENEKQQRKFPN